MPQQDPRSALRGTEPKIIPGPITLDPWEDPPVAPVAGTTPAPITLNPWEDPPAPAPPAPYPVPEHPGPAAVPGIVAPGWVRALAEAKRGLGIAADASGFNLASDVIGGGGQAAMDLIVGNPQGQARDRFYRALNTISGGFNQEPGRVWQQLSESGNAFLKGDLDKAANHLWYAVPFMGAAGQQMADYLDKGDYVGAFSHAAGNLAPFAHEPIASGISSVADAAGTARTFAGGAVGPAMKAAVAHPPLGAAYLGDLLGGHKAAAVAAALFKAPEVIRAGLRGGRTAVADAAALDALAQAQAGIDARALLGAQDASLARKAGIYETQEGILQPPGQIPPERQLPAGGSIQMGPAGGAAEEARFAGLGPEDVPPEPAAPAAPTIAPKATLDEIAMSPDYFGKPFAKLQPAQKAVVQRIYDALNAVGPVEVPSQAAQEAARRATPTAELTYEAPAASAAPAAPAEPPAVPPRTPSAIEQLQQELRDQMTGGQPPAEPAAPAAPAARPVDPAELARLTAENEALRKTQMEPLPPGIPPHYEALYRREGLKRLQDAFAKDQRIAEHVSTKQITPDGEIVDVEPGQGITPDQWEQMPLDQQNALITDTPTASGRKTKPYDKSAAERIPHITATMRWMEQNHTVDQLMRVATENKMTPEFTASFGTPEWGMMRQFAGLKEITPATIEQFQQRMRSAQAAPEGVPVEAGMTPEQAQGAIDSARAQFPQASTTTSVSPGGIMQGLQNAGEAALQRMRDRGTFSGTRLNAGIPLDDFKDMAIWGASKLGQGITRFPEWKRAMIGDAQASGAIGSALQGFKRQLRDLHSAAREYALKYDVVPYKPGMNLDDIHPLTSETIPKTGDKLTVPDVQQYLQDRIRKSMGAVPEDAPDATKVRRMLYLGRKEFAQQLEQPYSGVDWYGPDTAHGDQLLQQAFPELRDPVQNTIQKAISAAMSNNSNPLFEAYNGARIWQGFRDLPEALRRFPLKQPSGKNWPAQGIGYQIDKLNTMLDQLGEKGTADFLRGKVTGRDIKQFVPNAKGIRLNETYPGSLVLGPKIGRYFNDVMDLPQEGSTVDLWMMRQKGRRLGQLFDARGEPIEAPRTEGERGLQMAVDRKIAAENGVVPRDAQSVGWHFEQGLYKRLGIPVKSYRRSQGIQQFIDSISSQNAQ